VHLAASLGHADAVRLLLAHHRSGVNLRNARGQAPLAVAAVAGSVSAARAALEFGADVNAQDAAGNTALMAALKAGRAKMAAWLVARCGELPADKVIKWSAADAAGAESALLLCARLGNFELLTGEVLPRVRANIERTGGGEGQLAALLNLASAEGETSLGWLLKWGATPHLAAPALLAHLKALLAAGADPAQPVGAARVPPVSLAAATGVLEAFTTLAAACPDGVTAADAAKRTALHHAAAAGCVCICGELLERGVPPFGADAKGQTPLHIAASRGDFAIAIHTLLPKATVAKRAVLLRDAAGATVLHAALSAPLAGPEQAMSAALVAALDAADIAAIDAGSTTGGARTR